VASRPSPSGEAVNRVRLCWHFLNLAREYRGERRVDMIRKAWLALWGYTQRPIEDYRGLFLDSHTFPRRRRCLDTHKGWRP
jgi:hypothetical protein